MSPWDDLWKEKIKYEKMDESKLRVVGRQLLNNPKYVPNKTTERIRALLFTSNWTAAQRKAVAVHVAMQMVAIKKGGKK